MKKSFLVLTTILVVSLSGYRKKLDSTVVYKTQTHATSLSDEQLDILNGKGCSFGQWLATIAAWAGCTTASGGMGPILIACLGAVGGTVDCLENGGGVTGAPCTDPCPNGGYEEEYSTCQQLGGQILGTSQCNPNPNRICCQD